MTGMNLGWVSVRTHDRTSSPRGSRTSVLEPTPYASVEGVDLGKFRGTEFEVKDGEVLGDPFPAYRLGNCGASLLEVPA